MTVTIALHKLFYKKISVCVYLYVGVCVYLYVDVCVYLHVDVCVCLYVVSVGVCDACSHAKDRGRH